MSAIELPVRAYVEDLVKRCFPNRDWSRGSAINDLVIKAGAVLLQPLRHEIDTVKINQSVANWQVMSREAMDALAANWGRFRQTGSRATGQVRLYFETATDYQLNYLEFYSTDGVSYVLAAPVNISAVELLRNKRGDGSYFFDVTVVSVGIGNKYAAPAGSVIGMTNPPPGIIRCENVQDFSVTAPDESNFDIVNSMYRNLGLRNLVSRQSIRAPLYEQFPGILDIYITTSQDEKMIRDRVTVDVGGVPTEIRLGGMSDIWVNTTGVVARQVQFSYTPSTQTFKLVSEKQAQKTELIYSTPRVYLTLDGEYAAPEYLAAAFQLDESCQVVFDQGGLSSTALVATPKAKDRYTLATRDLVLGDTMIVFPPRYSTKNRFVTDVLGIPFDTVQAQVGDLAIIDGVARRATQVSPRVLELSPGASAASNSSSPFVYPGPTPVAAGSRAIPHGLLRTQLLPGGSLITDPGMPYYPGQRVNIVGSAAAGQYRLINWSDQNGSPAETTGVTNYTSGQFFLGNIVAEGALTSPVVIDANTIKYTFTAVGGGPARLPSDVGNTCFAYCHAGADPTVFDPRDGVSGDWLPIVSVDRTAGTVYITVTSPIPSVRLSHVTIVQGLKGDLTAGTPIYFENDGAAALPATTAATFAQCNTRYTNLTSVQIDAGVTTFPSPGIGTVATPGDLLVFEALSLDGTMIALAGNTGETHWTTTVAEVIDDNTVRLGLAPPTVIYAGTAFSLLRNTQVDVIDTGTTSAPITPTGTAVSATGIGVDSEVGDRVTFAVLQQRLLGSYATTASSPTIDTSGVYHCSNIRSILQVGDVVSVPSVPYTGTVTSFIDEDRAQLGTNPVSNINNGLAISAVRPGTFLQAAVAARTGNDDIVITPPLRQTVPSGTAYTVSREKLALATVYATAASTASPNVTLTSLIPSGQSWPLGLGDGAGLPVRATNPRTGEEFYRTIRFSTGGSVRKIEMKSPSQVVPLVMSAANYVPVQDTDIGQTVSQKLARSSIQTGSLAAPLPGTWILPSTGIQALARIGDVVEFDVSGTYYSAKITGFPDADHAQLDGAPRTQLSTGSISTTGSVTTGGVFTSTGVGTNSVAGDDYEFAIVGLPYVGTVGTTAPPDSLTFNTPYPTYAIPAGTTYKQFRHTTPGTYTSWHVWRNETSISFIGTLRSFDNASYTWYVQPNDPTRDVFQADLVSTVTVANRQETNLIAAIGAAVPFGYVAPLLGDIGTVVRQGDYAGILTGFYGQTWEVKPLSDEDLFDDPTATTFVDYLGTGKAGARGYGNSVGASPISLIHTTGSTAITLDAPFPFDITPTPAAEDVDAVTGCVLEVLSRNGRTGVFGDASRLRCVPDATINPDNWAGVNPSTEQMLFLVATFLGNYEVVSATTYQLNMSSSFEPVFAHLPNVEQSKKVTAQASVAAGSTTISFPGSLIGVWGHKGRVLKLSINGTEYFHVIDHPVDADTVALVATDPTVVPYGPSSTLSVEVVDAFISPAIRQNKTGAKTYRMVRPPAVLEPITLPVAGRNGVQSPTTDQFTDGLQDFGRALGGYDPTGIAPDAWLAVDSGDDASLVAKSIILLDSSTTVTLAADSLAAASTGVQYRVVRRPGWLSMEYWMPGEVVDATHIRVPKSALPADWSWTRNNTVGQWGLHVCRDVSTAGPVGNPAVNTAWELPHCRIVSVASSSTHWTLEIDATRANGMSVAADVFTNAAGFDSDWFGQPLRILPRVLDRILVRDVRANGIETYNYYGGQKFVLPLVRILSVEEVDPATQQPIGPVNYDLVVTDPGLRYSAQEVNRLVLTDPNMYLKPIRVSYLCDATIEAMDNFVNNDDVRVLNCNQLVKRMETIAVDVQIQVKSTRSQAELTQLLASYINTLPSTTRVSKDGIIQFLYAQGVVTYINMASLRIDGYYYPAENGVPVVYSNVDEVFGAATAAYIAGNISITLVSE